MARHDDMCERAAPDDGCACLERKARASVLEKARDEYGYQYQQLQMSLALFFQVHDDPEDEANYEPPLAGGDDQLQHLARWLLGEGWVKP